MILFRRAEPSDLSGIFQLTKKSGIGLTTLPKDKSLLNERLSWSSQSFDKKVSHPEEEYYLFVLVDTDKNKIIGTSAVEASLGHDLPFYSYKISKRTRMCHSLGIRSDNDVLYLVNDHQGKSEICTLFLDEDYRHGGNGLLLSKARFLFMAQYPNRFEDVVIAEMRGMSDKEGRSPFWESVGRHFFHMTFPEADQLTVSSNKQFIADLMPRNPIYVKLLSASAQNVIGVSHPSTQPAMNILLREGFRYQQSVDIFDAGPTIEAPIQEIKTFAASRLMTVQQVLDEVNSPRYLVSNTSTSFRAAATQIIYDEEAQTCVLSKIDAKALGVTPGDQVRVAPFHIPRTPALS